MIPCSVESCPNISKIFVPELASFYGIKVMMYTHDNKQHHLPHIHARYQNGKAVFSIPEGELLAGSFPPKKMRMIQTWIDIHADELIQCWNLAVSGDNPPKIEPLR